MRRRVKRRHTEREEKTKQQDDSTLNKSSEAEGKKLAFSPGKRDHFL